LYQLTGPNYFSGALKADGDGIVVFELPDSVTPATYQAQLLQFNLATVVPQGTSPPVKLPPIPPPDTKQDLLATLQQKQHITALAENPGTEPQLLFFLPWSLGPEQLELQLMTPEFKPGMSLLLGPKDTSFKTPRWRCTATISLDTGDTEATQVLVGDFEVEALSAWQARLQFRPAGNREKGHDAAYAALRCCRLCLVIAGQPVATCQMFPVQTVGRLKLSLPEGDKERKLQKVAAPPCCSQPQLVFDAEQTRRGDYVVRADVYNKARRLLLTQQDVPLTQAGLEFNNGIPTMTKTKWALDGARKRENYDSTDKSQKESDLDRRTKFLTVCDTKLESFQTEKVSLENLMNSQAKEEDKNSKRPRLVALRQTLIPGEEQARRNVQAIIEKLQNDLERIAEIKALNDIHFILDEWSITVDTTLQKPLHDGNALETTVVLVKGSAKDPPLAFVAPPQAKSQDLPKTDAP